MSRKLTKDITGLNNSAKEYFQTKVDLIKVSLLEKSTKLTSLILNIWILVTLIIWILAFAAAAFAAWYGEVYGNLAEGLLIAGGVLLLITLLFVLFRKNIFTTSILRQYSKIIFDDENDEKV